MSSQTVCLIDGWMTAVKDLVISLIHLVNCLLLSTYKCQNVYGAKIYVPKFAKMLSAKKNLTQTACQL